MSGATRAGLEALLVAWNRACSSESIFERTTWEVDVPDELAATVTTREPYRSAVLRDARSYLAVPAAFGIGMEVELPELKLDAYEQWERSVHRLQYRLVWGRDMSGRETDYASRVVDRVAVEDGRWRVVSLWSDVDRAEFAATTRALAVRADDVVVEPMLDGTMGFRLRNVRLHHVVLFGVIVATVIWLLI